MAHGQAHAGLRSPGRLKLPFWYYGLAAVLTTVGFGTFAFVVRIDPERAWGAYLIALFFSLIVGLAGPLFIATQYLSSAGWSVTVRRVPEAMAAHLLPVAGLCLGIAFGGRHLYRWTHPELIAHDMSLFRKAAYLNPARMAVALTIAFAAWIGVGGWMVSNSRAQDLSGDPRLTRRNTVLSAVFVVLFALTFSVSSFDLLMSLEPHWGSTMWAVYCFAMLMQAGMAWITLALVMVRRAGKLHDFVTPAHLHDMGKLVFTFTVFYAYIAFSQFMLIWYANLPEETAFFVRRLTSGWGAVALMLPLGKFLLPFLVLLPQRAKHTPAVLVPVCVWVLFATFLELWWIVMPTLVQTRPTLPSVELLVLLGFVGVSLVAFGLSLSRHNLIPTHDPRLDESVAHHG